MKKYKNQSLKSAFSMLELVFVIVILGIVSSIGAEIVAKVYDSYITQRAVHRSSMKVELAATQIANRLTYAVPGTIIGTVSRTNDNFLPIEDLPGGNAYRVLQWIGSDEDSMGARTSANDRPGWSGVVDLIATISGSSFDSPGSNFSLTNTIIGNLSDSTKSIVNAAIFFPDLYSATTVGYNGTPITGISTVSVIPPSTIVSLAAPRAIMKEHYKLAWSSYAVVPVPPRSGLANLFDLELRYNFQPWNGEQQSAATSVLLIEDISVFQFTGTGDTTRFKICKQERISATTHITNCKEKAVIR